MEAKTRKARKPHVCTLCFGDIEVGSEYVYERITPWDHPDNERFFDYRAHPLCDKFWHAEYGDLCDYAFSEDYRDFKESLAEWVARIKPALASHSAAQPVGEGGE